MVSTLFAASLVAVSAGQSPGDSSGGQPDKEGLDPKKNPGEKGKGAAAVDAAIAAALANDPDVRVARARIALAEAELAKAKQAVVLKVMTLSSSIKEHQANVEQSRERALWSDRMVKTGHITAGQAQAERSKLESALAALARAEAELRMLTGGNPDKDPAMGGADSPDVPNAVNQGLRWLSRLERYEQSYQAQTTAAALLASIAKSSTVQGPVPDRIRAALDKPVKLGAKGDKVTFEQALEVFKKEAGLDVPVRGPGDLVKSPVIVSHGEEMPVGAWLQLYQDYGAGKFYVREYGLLFTDKFAAPPDAPTLTEFWKQKPMEKKGNEPK